MPPPRKFDDINKWTIGTPDLIVQMPKDVPVPAKAPDQWRDVLADPGLTEDRYIKSVELKPIKGYKAIHHGVLRAIASDGLLEVVHDVTVTV